MADFKAFRRDNHMTQQQAAEFFQVNQGFISQMENRSRPIPEGYYEKALADMSIIADNLKPDDYDGNETFDYEKLMAAEEPAQYGNQVSVPVKALAIMQLQAESLVRKDKMMDKLIDYIIRKNEKEE